MTPAPTTKNDDEKDIEAAAADPKIQKEEKLERLRMRFRKAVLRENVIIEEEPNIDGEEMYLKLYAPFWRLCIGAERLRYKVELTVSFSRAGMLIYAIVIFGGLLYTPKMRIMNSAVTITKTDACILSTLGLWALCSISRPPKNDRLQLQQRVGGLKTSDDSFTSSIMCHYRCAQSPCYSRPASFDSTRWQRSNVNGVILFVMVVASKLMDPVWALRWGRTARMDSLELHDVAIW
jgi:hypothetical protein